MNSQPPNNYRAGYLRNLKDCPRCGYGTLDFKGREQVWICADCGAKFPVKKPVDTTKQP